MADLPVDSQFDNQQRMLAAIQRLTDHLKAMENETNEQAVEQMVTDGQVLVAQFQEETEAMIKRLRSLAVEGAHDE